MELIDPPKRARWKEELIREQEKSGRRNVPYKFLRPCKHGFMALVLCFTAMEHWFLNWTITV